MKNLLLKYATIPTLFLLPVVAGAQTFNDGRVLSNFFGGLTAVIQNVAIPLLIAVAFLVFVYGAIQFFLVSGNDGEKRDEGRKLMLWGIMAFVLIVSVWGIVLLISGGLGLDGTQSLQQVPKPPAAN